MPEIEISASDRHSVNGLLDTVRRHMGGMTNEAKLVFAVEMSRLLKPQHDELKRRIAASKGGGV